MIPPSITPEGVVLVDQLSTLMATSGRVHTTHELTQLAPARVLVFPCAWGTCLPRNDAYPAGFVAEWHDRETGQHYIHVERSAQEVGSCLAYLAAIGHTKLVTFIDGDHQKRKAWLWTGPVPVSADRLETMWSLTP